MLSIFFLLLLSSADFFFKINFLNKIFQENYQIDNAFGFR